MSSEKQNLQAAACSKSPNALETKGAARGARTSSACGSTVWPAECAGCTGGRDAEVGAAGPDEAAGASRCTSAGAVAAAWGAAGDGEPELPIAGRVSICGERVSKRVW
eukprot:3605907-Alexandrium_andersonii.AAC.1